jgi:hypothetical protein
MALATVGAAFFAGRSAIKASKAADAANATAEASGRLLELEQERRDDEKAANTRAQVHVALRLHTMNGVSRGGGGYTVIRNWLQVWNSGPATARDLRVTQTGASVLTEATQLPSELASGQRADLSVDTDNGEIPIPEIDVHWVDGAGAYSITSSKVFQHTST